MKKIELSHSIKINRKIEDVFAYSIDPNNAKDWRVGLLAVKNVSDKAVKEGTVIDESVVVMGMTMRSRTEVAELKKNKKRKLKIVVGSSLKVNMTEKYEEKDNKTILTISGSAKLKGVQQLMSKTIEAQMQKQLEEEMGNIKAILED